MGSEMKNDEWIEGNKIDVREIAHMETSFNVTTKFKFSSEEEKVEIADGVVFIVSGKKDLDQVRTLNGTIYKNIASKFLVDKMELPEATLLAAELNIAMV
jgi:hypothetical protein